MKKERVAIQELEQENFKQRFVYTIPFNREPLVDEEETLRYMCHLREFVWETVGASEAGEELPPISKRIDLFRIEEVEFLHEEMGISEVLEGAKELSLQNYQTSRSAIFNKFQEFDLALRLSYMNIQLEDADLRLVCIRGRSECMIGMLTTGEIEEFVGDFEEVEAL